VFDIRQFQSTRAPGSKERPKERERRQPRRAPFGHSRRIDLVAAAREATESRFDVLIPCAFNFDAHASKLTKLGPLSILKAKMNPDLHMADELKNTGQGQSLCRVRTQRLSGALSKRLDAKAFPATYKPFWKANRGLQCKSP
jgi:hypothetical protein